MRLESDLTMADWTEVLRELDTLADAPEILAKVIDLAHQALRWDGGSDQIGDGKVRGPTGICWWEPSVGEWLLLPWGADEPVTVRTPSYAIRYVIGRPGFDEVPITRGQRPRVRRLDDGLQVLPPLRVVGAERCAERSGARHA